MPTYIVKLESKSQSYYMEWSTIVDAPTSYGMNLEEFKKFYQDSYGSHGMTNLDARLARVEAKGCSSLVHDNVDQLISCNRAGENERH